jgi:hypothetical protein
MTDPDTRRKVSTKRRRNYIAKVMRETMPKKIYKSVKDREAQRKYRIERDPDSDYEELDNWLLKELGYKEE